MNDGMTCIETWFKKRTGGGGGGGGIWERVTYFLKLAFPSNIHLDLTAKQIQDSQWSKVGQDTVSDHDDSCDNLYSTCCLYIFEKGFRRA